MQRTCARCGRTPAAGNARIGDDWYCHGDEPGPTCYELGVLETGRLMLQSMFSRIANWPDLPDSRNTNPNQGEQRQP